MEETQENQSPSANIGFPPAAPAGNNQPKKNWKWLVILIIFLIVIGGVTFFVFKSSGGTAVEESPTPNTSLTNIATPRSTPTPEPVVVKKEDIKIEVLNGTGIAGEAGILAEQLKSLGYESVTVGNAASQDSTDTEVTFASSVDQSVVSEITTKLNGMYTSVTTGSSTPPSGVDIQIITGVRKGQTTTAIATPTATAEPTATP